MRGDEPRTSRRVRPEGLGRLAARLLALGRDTPTPPAPSDPGPGDRAVGVLLRSLYLVPP